MKDQNEIAGTIPTRMLRHMSSLNILNLGNNKLTGTLPIELESFSNLKVLKLNSNSLVGAVPTQLGAISTLSTFQYCLFQVIMRKPINLLHLSAFSNP